MADFIRAVIGETCIKLYHFAPQPQALFKLTMHCHEKNEADNFARNILEAALRSRRTRAMVAFHESKASDLSCRGLGVEV